MLYNYMWLDKPNETILIWKCTDSSETLLDLIKSPGTKASTEVQKCAPYHGDIHTNNVLIKTRDLEVKVVWLWIWQVSQW